MRKVEDKILIKIEGGKASADTCALIAIASGLAATNPASWGIAIVGFGIWAGACAP